MFLLIPGCIPPPEEWEDIESNYDHVLNVLGIVSLDPGISSFVGLYRTTDLGEMSQIFVGVDTVWYDEENDIYHVDSIYEPAALIKDATVQISDGTNTFNFTFVESEEFYDTIVVPILGWEFVDTTEVRMNYYKDTTDSFTAQPGVTYQLTINSPNYDPVVGELTTPNYPTLIDSLISDTISSRDTYKIFWDKWDDSTRGYLSGSIIQSNDYWKDGTDWCRPYFERVVKLSDSIYTVPTEFCDLSSDSSQTADYFIRLTAMDDNYFTYFVKGEIDDYSNFLLNSPTTKGRSIGIEGGFGVFGSIASDNIFRTIVSE